MAGKIAHAAESCVSVVIAVTFALVAVAAYLAPPVIVALVVLSFLNC